MTGRPAPARATIATVSTADDARPAGPLPPGVRLRAAVPTDADDLGRVHVDAWRFGYRTLIPPGFLDGLDPVARAAWWTQVLQDGENAVGTPFAAGAPDVGDRRALVAEQAGRVRGFVVFGTDHESGADGRVHALNVDPPSWGRGLDGPCWPPRSPSSQVGGGPAQCCGC